MFPVCPVRSGMRVSGRFFMAVFFFGDVRLKLKPGSAVVYRGQWLAVCSGEGASLRRFLFFLADWFDNDLVCHWME